MRTILLYLYAAGIVGYSVIAIVLIISIIRLRRVGVSPLAVLAALIFSATALTRTVLIVDALFHIGSLTYLIISECLVLGTVLVYILLRFRYGLMAHSPEEVMNTRRRAEEAERMLKDQEGFLADVAHELKTPLTSIHGYALVLKEQVQDEAVITYLAAVERQSLRMRQLIDKLLDATRIESGAIKIRLEPANLVELLSAAIETVQQRYQDHEFVLDAPSAATVPCDKVRLDQVFVNVLENAAKYSPLDSTVHIQAMISERTAIVRVCDQGPGIPRVLRKHVFERFFRADKDNSPPGLGLGLYISYQIIRLHKGNIQIGDGIDGQGACVTITLPTHQADRP